MLHHFFDPEGGSQNATLVVVVLGISSLKIPQGFLNMHRSARKLCTHTFLLIFPTDLPSQILKLICSQ